VTLKTHAERVDHLLLFSIRRPFWALGIAVALTAFFGAQLPDLKKDVRIEKVFPEDSPSRTDYEEFKRLFGRDDETALCLLELQTSVLEVHSLERIHALTEGLRGLPLVDQNRVVSLTSAPLVRTESGDVLDVGPFFEPARAKDWDANAYDLLLRDHPAFADRLLSDDRRLAAFLVPLVHLDEGARTEKIRRQFARDVRAFFAKQLQPDERVHLDGFAITYDTVLGLLVKDVLAFYPLALVLLLVSLGVVFRRALPTVLAVCTVIASVVWTLGSMAVLGIPMNFISTCIPVMILVVCVGDAVHLIAHYHQHLATSDKTGALEIAVKTVGRACFFTSVTTSAGFLSLLTSQVELVRELGAPVALGVVYAFVITFLLIPPVLAWAKRPTGIDGVTVFAGPLAGLARFVQRRPGAVIAGTLALAVVALFTAPNVDRENRLLNDFDADHPIMKTRILFEERMGGVAPLEILIDTREPGRGMAPDVQQGLLDLSRSLRSDAFKKQGVLFALSVSDFLSDANYTWHHRSGATKDTLPKDGDKLHQLRYLYELFSASDPTLDFLDDSDAPQVLRVQLRIQNLYTTPFYALAAAIEAEAKRLLPPDVDVKVTGNTIMSQAINRSLVEDMLKSFGLAFVLVGGLMLFFFRSPRLALLAVVPNLLPLLFVISFMSLTGITLSLTTSIVFTIVFGISVDDTIHFVSSLAHNESSGESDPIGATIRHTGLSLVLSSVVLVLGFSVLFLSQFKPNRYFGLLVSLTVVFALVGDLLLLPALLWLAKRRRRPAEPAADLG
jgi:uncharacterized protein